MNIFDGFKQTIRALLVPDSTESAIAEFARSRARRHADAESVIAVECVDDPFYLGLFAALTTSLQAGARLRFEGILTRSLNAGESTGVLRFCKIRLLGMLASVRCGRLHLTFLDSIGARSTSLRPVADMIDLFRAFRAWRSLRSRADLLGLEVDGIPVGDLVNDSFLRFRPSAWLELRDRYLLVVIWQAYRDARRSVDYFRRRRPRIYLTGYSSYVQHGVAVRAAIRAGIRVLSFGNYQDFCKPLDSRDWMADRNAHYYAAGFESLDRQEERLAEAEAALSARLAGGIDSATAYMRESAYAETTRDVPDVRGAMVVFLHDFFDSPHIYYDMIFPDFWEWICFTIETFQDAGIPFYLKPHPNQIDLSSDSLSALLRKYPGLKMIEPTVTNRQLAAAGMRCAVTLYGTVGHEMAFMGIPTIAGGRHPHSSFGFCQTAWTREEYARFLRAGGPADFDAPRAREESLRFYHMHNRAMDDEQLALRDTSLRLRGASTRSLPPAEVVAILADMQSLPAFQQFVDHCRIHAEGGSVP